MKRTMTAFASGAVFGAGLLVAGMTKPSKVIGFLDVAGAWDPSLAFVMMGGIAVHLALYKWIVRRPSPLAEAEFKLPTRRDIDTKLVAGSAIFGVGWGLGGFCPGPGITSALRGGPAVMFVVSMLVGMALHTFLSRVRVRADDA
jgi:uncharacterized membrane protein YedE/YeeE